MKLVSYHNGKQISYWLGIAIGLDQFIGVFVPGAEVDRTISHRLGKKKVKLALRAGKIKSADVFDDKGEIIHYSRMPRPTQLALASTDIPFRRHPLAAVIDRALERIDPGHSLKSIGA